MAWKGDVQRIVSEKKKREEEEESARQTAQVETNREGLKKFKCHICDKPASKPKMVPVIQYGNNHMAPDWTQPGDLYTCIKCGGLTCDDCQYDGVCKTCWEKELGIKL